MPIVATQCISSLSQHGFATRSKRAVVKELFIMFSNLDHSFAVQLNFRNFRNFRNECFAFKLFHIVSQIMLRKFRKYEFRKVSQIQVSQFYVCLGRFRKFAWFRKCEFCKVLQIQALQGFANRFFVSQGFRNGQFADGTHHLLGADAKPFSVKSVSTSIN